MSLKDWKKVGKNYWKYRKGVSNDKTNSIRVYKSEKWNWEYPYQVYVVGVPSYNSGIEGSFKSKSQALKFAKSYMRKH